MLNFIVGCILICFALLQLANSFCSDNKRKRVHDKFELLTLKLSYTNIMQIGSKYFSKCIYTIFLIIISCGAVCFLQEENLSIYMRLALIIPLLGSLIILIKDFRRWNDKDYGEFLLGKIYAGDEKYSFKLGLKRIITICREENHKPYILLGLVYGLVALIVYIFTSGLIFRLCLAVFICVLFAILMLYLSNFLLLLFLSLLSSIAWIIKFVIEVLLRWFWKISEFKGGIINYFAGVLGVIIAFIEVYKHFLK
jgi:hypothetical protein